MGDTANQNTSRFNGLRLEYVLPYWDIVKKAVETAATIDTRSHRAKTRC